MAKIFDQQKASRLLPALILAGLVLLVVAAALLLLSAHFQAQERDYRRHVAELRELATTMPVLAGEAARGDQGAMGRLAGSRDSLVALLQEVEAGRASFAVLSSPSARRLGDEPAWPALLQGAEAVLEARKPLTELPTWAGEAASRLGSLLADTGNAVSAPGGAGDRGGGRRPAAAVSGSGPGPARRPGLLVHARRGCRG